MGKSRPDSVLEKANRQANIRRARYLGLSFAPSKASAAPHAQRTNLTAVLKIEEGPTFFASSIFPKRSLAKARRG
jgi:hypothetical protein